MRALATFWAKVWTRIADGGCDMLELDDDAVEAGLMALVPHAQPCNDETCRCEGADEVYKLTPAGRAALTARATQEAGD